MSGHDPLCPESEPDPGDTVRQHGCLCYLIGKVRADERDKAHRAGYLEGYRDHRMERSARFQRTSDE